MKDNSGTEHWQAYAMNKPPTKDRKQMHSILTNKTGNRAQRVASLCLTAGIALSTLNSAALGGPESKSQLPQQQQSPKNFDLSRLSARDREDIIMVMPKADADADEMNDVVKENKGTVIGQLRSNDITVVLIKVEHGKARLVEQKLRADKKHFNDVNANHREPSTAFVPKDPGFTAPGAWHHARLGLPKAWEYLYANHANRLQGMIVMDSGCNTQDVSRDSQGTNVSGEYKKIAKGLKPKLVLGSVEGNEEYIIQKGNLARTMTYTINDQNGHGTWVSSAAAGSANTIGTIGVNPLFQICPIQIADGAYNTTIFTDDLAVVSAMMCAFDAANAPVNNVRIINISYANMFDEVKHPVLIQLFKHWYYKKDGLVFVSAGNDGRSLATKDLPFVNVISAMGHVKEMKLADIKAGSGKSPWQSAFGPCVDFTAPGEDIQVTDVNGTNTSVDGTSFSSPIVAGIAALCLSVNPKLHNYEIENILKRSAVNTTSGRNSKFGWGMPDAERAIKMARGQ